MDNPRVFARLVGKELARSGPTSAGPPPPPPRPPPEKPPDPPPSNEEAFQAIGTLFKHVMAQISALETEVGELKARRNAVAGRDGAPGVGIQDLDVDGNGDLIVTFTDGFVKNCGRVRGEDAAPAPPPQALQFERDETTGRIKGAILK
jgi:hypothetical protein